MYIPTWRNLPQMLITFFLVVIGWIIFRADTIEQAGNYMLRMCSRSMFEVPFLMNRMWYIPLFFSLMVLFVVE